VVSVLSPLKIMRNRAGCTGCRYCSAACPSGLPVHLSATVHSPECSGCLTCVANCPERDVLRIASPFWRRPLPVWLFPLLVVALFAAGVGSGMATGHWQSILTYADYRQLIPLVPNLGH